MYFWPGPLIGTAGVVSPSNRIGGIFKVFFLGGLRLVCLGLGLILARVVALVLALRPAFLASEFDGCCPPRCPEFAAAGRRERAVRTTVLAVI